MCFYLTNMLQRKKWENLRADIEMIVRENDISPDDFKALGIHDEWQKIEENIYHTFCRLDHPTSRPVWLWEYFKLDEAYSPVSYPLEMLEQLVDVAEDLWFFVNGDKDKFWFYQGKIKAIRKVIEECSYMDELYIASKKYDWLICINHHDNLIATGNIIPERLRDLTGIEPGKD